ncbi:MAG: lipid II flippase MurJ, partial [bacterium]|nr:lipid II flippase MurJ [bacterium]
LLLQPVFLGLSGILASVTQIHGRFLLYATAPLLYNGGIILGIAALYPLFGLPGIAFGVVLGAFLHMGIQIPFITRSGYGRLSDMRFNMRELWAIISVSVPRTVSIAANHIALLVLVATAATLGFGAVSVFNLAFNLQSAPLAIIGASYSVAAFPTLARYFSSGDTVLFVNQISTAARHIIFWSFPLMALFVVLRAQIVRVILGTGAFDWSDTRLTAAALALFVISLAAQALSLLFVRGYYASGNTWKPLAVNVTSAVGIVGTSFWFLHIFNTNDTWRYFVEQLLRVSDVPGTAVLMLPLAYTIFAILNVVVYIVLFERDFKLLHTGIVRTAFHSFSAAVLAGFFAHLTLRVLSLIVNIDTFLGIFAQGTIAGIIGVTAGIVTLVLLKSREINEAWNTLHKKIWLVRVIFPSGVDRGTDV